MGDNINGPSLIHAPDWLPNPLGKYYLYFAHHQGTYIRLAFADDLAGPWRMHTPGVLEVREAFFQGHIASPDVHIDQAERRMRMYMHGPIEGHGQVTRVAVSHDGLEFKILPEILGPSYFRVFFWEGWHYALAMPGLFLRSRDGLTDFQRGPQLFTLNMRHCALKLDGNRLSVFFSNAGDCPERILLSSIELCPDWHQWRATDPVTVLEPETEYEGVDLLLEPSVRGLARQRVRQLRDPAIFQEEGRTCLLYSVAGEAGIALAELHQSK